MVASPAPQDRKLSEEGYVLLYRPGHVGADAEGFVGEHRLVMEEHLGGPLLPGEIVHHRDRHRANNVIKNLLLCPTNDLHLQLHAMMRSKKDGMARALEQWFEQMMAERRVANGQVPSPPRLRPQPTAMAQQPRSSPVVNVVEQLAGISNKEERSECLGAVLASVDPSELATLLGQRVESADTRTRCRLLWSLGELRCDAAAPPFLRLLREPPAPDKRSLRIALYSALSKEKLAGIPAEEIAAAAISERGQALQYVIKIVPLYCSPGLATSVLDRIEAIPDPDYSTEALQRSLLDARKAVRRAIRCAASQT